jgi:hypothetical protein
MTDIDIYPVGLLHDWQHRKIRPLRKAMGYPRRQLRARNWRALRNYLNGYLAEPRNWPPGVTRCGRGWTKRAALRRLNRAIARIGGSVDV